MGRRDSHLTRTLSGGMGMLAGNHLTPEEEETVFLSAAEKTHRNIRGDVVLFIDVLRDEHGDPVFNAEDTEIVAEIYGPVHSRLLHQALDLMTAPADVEKKFGTR
ncbi:phage tail protein [Xenorhabdus szentirmaii]|nr:phage tail protein [Xenorhabdus szentirmaii]